MIYHQFIVDKADSVINVEITPEYEDAKFMIYINYREKPALNMYELLIPLQDVRKANGRFLKSSLSRFVFSSS